MHVHVCTCMFVVRFARLHSVHTENTPLHEVRKPPIIKMLAIGCCKDAENREEEREREGGRRGREREREGEREG